ncbi:hypothetical protein METUNv1_01837 [Methyloversatilis universalis FAM5]|uniref:Uncharacterized protein n=1 Tax=Methyloversatilis universalis (strain ATCC BAA-1314 / DSM 25237 / JCM 13912 / CCUG 52030 / FAM5) TaxID=1000565 RepID=F5RBN7_METUF|nr:hypothetical protein METUNv1_01837 [Methyloversatilis universalis FAM5]
MGDQFEGGGRKRPTPGRACIGHAGLALHLQPETGRRTADAEELDRENAPYRCGNRVRMGPACSRAHAACAPLFHNERVTTRPDSGRRTPDTGLPDATSRTRLLPALRPRSGPPP